MASRPGLWAFERRIARKDLLSDRFATLSAVLGVALGVATVDIVLVIDANTRSIEAQSWSTNPDLPVDTRSTVSLAGVARSGTAVAARDAKSETHEDYQVMRSAIRLGSLSAFLTGALIVFFTFRVVIEQRRRELALLRSLGATQQQVARILLFEALAVGFAGATLGLGLSPFLSIAAAAAGFTTTGRASIGWVWFPWKTLIFVSAIGGATALLGVARPIRDVLRLDVARALRPAAIDLSANSRRKNTGATLIALPFMALVYVLIRPFFFEALPSFAFFVLETGLVSAGFLATLTLVPEIVRGLGAFVARLLPPRPLAPRLLTIRRVERVGHELAFAVSGVMLVFALILALHVVTHALKREVVEWASTAIRGKAYVYGSSSQTLDPSMLASLPPDVLRLRFSTRTPWPNAVIAVDSVELARFTEGTTPDAEAVGRELRKGKVVLSTMMARRYGIGVGDKLEIAGVDRRASLEVIAVTDAVGYMPMIGPYRNSKTYALISDEDFDLISPFVAPIGAGVALRFAGPPRSEEETITAWRALIPSLRKHRRVHIEIGSRSEAERITETDRDFAMFDLILLATAVLAAIGVANSLVLSGHVRRREIALYRVLGMEVSRVRALFLMEGAFIGLLGGFLSVLLGIPLAYAAVGALEVISAFQVRFEIPPTYPLYAFFGALIISLLASLYPAARAGRLSGRESVHHE